MGLSAPEAINRHLKRTGTQFHPSQLKTDWHNILPESLKGTATVLYRGQLKRRQHHFTQQSSSDCNWEYISDSADLSVAESVTVLSAMRTCIPWALV